MPHRESHSYKPPLFPSELAHNMERLVDKVINLANSTLPENKWARDAVLAHKSRYLEDSHFYSDTGIVLSFDKLKTLCPELYNVIEQGMEVANTKGRLHKTPEAPNIICIDKYQNNLLYNRNFHFIGIGIPWVKSTAQIEETVSGIAHEWGHAHQSLKKRLDSVTKGDVNVTDNNHYKKTFAKSFKDVHESEHDADRYATPINRISNMIGSSIDNKYKYINSSETHPSFYKRIQVLLEEALGDGIFGTNGTWVERANSSGKVFEPHNIEKSEQIVKEQIDAKLFQHKVRLNPYNSSAYKAADNGEIVTNYRDFKELIHDKAECIMKQLSQLIFSKTKQECMNYIKTEIANFREENKPEILSIEAMANTQKMADKMQRSSLKFQRG